MILPHPRRPIDPNAAILADFPTGHATLRPDHLDWLRRRVPILQEGGWAFIRGFASRLGSESSNRNLSRERAKAVREFLASFDGVDPRHFTGTRWAGEEWSSGGPREDGGRWRSAEVFITPDRPSPAASPTVPHVERVVQQSWRRMRHVTPREGAPGVGENLASFFRDPTGRGAPAGRRVARLPADHVVNTVTESTTCDSSYGPSFTQVRTEVTVTEIRYDWGPRGGDTFLYVRRSATVNRFGTTRAPTIRERVRRDSRQGRELLPPAVE